MQSKKHKEAEKKHIADTQKDVLRNNKKNKEKRLDGAGDTMSKDKDGNKSEVMSKVDSENTKKNVAEVEMDEEGINAIIRSSVYFIWNLNSKTTSDICSPVALLVCM